MKSIAYFTVVGAVAAAMLFSRPFAARAQTAAPIQVTSCTVEQAVRNPRPFWYPWPRTFYAPYTDGLDISYVDTSNKTADRVLFQVNYRGDKERIVDAGTFSPGATINHQFGDFTGDAYIGPKPNYCRVAAVRFTDGTVWRAPNVRARVGSL